LATSPLIANMSGNWNVGLGNRSLYENQTGDYNVGVGFYAGQTLDGSAGTGNGNTGLGAGTAFGTGSLTNATAIGNNAVVSESNALVLGCIPNMNNCVGAVSVGIGTSTPKSNYLLDVEAASSLANAVYVNGTVTVGNLNVMGTLSKGSGSFRIDHPLDPANKYLYHSFVESPDMMNVYNGNVTTDEHGLAVVTLPDYFEALNRDFRYQLTVIGQFAQAIVLKKVVNNRFVIQTDKPTVEVSWQITGIRQDAYANAHRIQVEVDKPEYERGHYLHPELFGASEEQAVGYGPAPPSAEAAGTPLASRK
jgi:hypothetical protein